VAAKATRAIHCKTRAHGTGPKRLAAWAERPYDGSVPGPPVSTDPIQSEHSRARWTISLLAACLVLDVLGIGSGLASAPVGTRESRFTPGWAVGYWFVPFVNLVRPYQIVADLWLRSDVLNGEGSTERRNAPALVHPPVGS